MQLAVFEDSVILHVATLGDWQVTTAARLVKVSADLLSIASNRLSLRMFFLKSLFHFNLKNGWNIRFYWWKSCTWGFAFNHVFNGNKSAATWLLFLVVLISFGLVTPCKMKNNNNFVKSGGCPWNMPFCRKLLFSLGWQGNTWLENFQPVLVWFLPFLSLALVPHQFILRGPFLSICHSLMGNKSPGSSIPYPPVSLEFSLTDCWRSYISSHRALKVPFIFFSPPKFFSAVVRYRNAKKINFKDLRNLKSFQFYPQ